jgi:hypothetical protein
MKKISIRYSDDFLFYVGVLLIPFDNLFFAPSTGWAAISPIIFVLYLIRNYSRTYRILHFKSDIIIKILSLITICFFNYLIVGFEAKNVLSALMSLGCGLGFYLAMAVFYQKNGFKKNQFIVDLLFYAYTFSFIYGLLDYFNIAGFANVARALSKRYYPGRLQFTFTEPSFISMHLYGIIFPVLVYAKEKKMGLNVTRLGILFGLFVITSVIFGSSSRFLLDTLFVTVVFLILFYRKNKLALAFSLLILPLVFIVGPTMLNEFLGTRINSIITNGIYSDPSLAARVFRINAILQGMIKDFRGTLFGYGFANTYIPFNQGYDIAILSVTTSYMVEINAIRGVVTDTFFCLPLRFLAEFGIFGTIMLFSFFFSKKNLWFFILFIYLYLQFDSYAFYTMWILLFAKYYRNFLPNKAKNFFGFRLPIIHPKNVNV